MGKLGRMLNQSKIFRRKCGFKKRNRESYYIESKHAEKIARRNWEKQNEES